MSAYIPVTWTGGDTITEAKLDNMVSNDRAEDAHESGVYLLNSSGKLKFKNISGVVDAEIYEDSNNVLQIIQGAGGFAGLDINLATQIRGAILAGTNKAQFPPATRDFTIVETLVQVAGDGTQAGGQMTFDINKNGTSIWAATQANRMKLAASSARGTVVAANIDTITVDKYDNFGVDVDVTDSTARNLIFVIIGV